MSLMPELYLSPEEYLERERKAETKSEYLNGYVYGMAGASLRHNQISLNLAVVIGSQLRGRPCGAYINDLRVKIDPTGLYTYPDLVALCGEPQFEDSHLDTLTNPQVIIEILSDSTEAYDRGTKLSHYIQIPTLQDYVLIAQNRYCVDHFVRADEKWVMTEVRDLAEEIYLDSIGCDLTLRDIYDKVKITGGPDNAG